MEDLLKQIVWSITGLLCLTVFIGTVVYEGRTHMPLEITPDQCISICGEVGIKSYTTDECECNPCWINHR